MSTLDIGTIFNRVTTQIAQIGLFVPLLAIISIATSLSIT